MIKFSFRMYRLKYLLLFITLLLVAKSSNLIFLNNKLLAQPVHLESLWDLPSKFDVPESQRYNVTVNVSKSLHITLPHYLSVNIDSNQIRNRLRGFDFSSPKLRTIASALRPSNVRWGGTYADFIHFDPLAVDDANLEKKDLSQYVDTSTYPAFANRKKLHYVTLSGARWDNMTRFCDDVGWDIMWDFNFFVWKDGQWDPTEADKFLKYSASRGVRIPSFQLGNEPNSFKFNFNFSVDPAVLVQGLKSLKGLISQYPQYDSSQLYGPESTNLDKSYSARIFLARFLEAGGCDIVTEIGLHHYYLDALTATLENFMDPKVMDALKVQLQYAQGIVRKSCRVPKPIRLTETSSASGGGTEGLSNGYVAGFLWLDKLGLAAQNQVTHVFRQSFYGGRYALVDSDLNPNPDLFLSVLYKRLVEGPVFDVTNTDIPPQLRLYAHCVRNSFYKYPAGALVLYYVYVGTTPASLTMDQFNTLSEVHIFLFTPGDNNGLKSKKIKLNNILLEVKDDQFPSMNPRPHLGDILVPSQSYGFIVIPDAEVHLCKLYHRSRDVDGTSS